MASEVLLKHAIDKDMLPLEGGFFGQTELTIKVIGTDGKNMGAEHLLIDDQTGTLSYA